METTYHIWSVKYVCITKKTIFLGKFYPNLHNFKWKHVSRSAILLFVQEKTGDETQGDRSPLFEKLGNFGKGVKIAQNRSKPWAIAIVKQLVIVL